MVTIELNKEYSVGQGSTVTINTSHSTLGVIAFALDKSPNFGTPVALSPGLNVFQNFVGRFRCSGFSGGNMEYQITPSS